MVVDKGAKYRDAFRLTGLSFMATGYSKCSVNEYFGFVMLAAGILIFFIPALALSRGIDFFNGRCE